MGLARPPRIPRVRRLIAFSAVIMLLFGSIVLYQAFREYDMALERGKVNAQRLATILADQVNLSFETVDLSLQRAVERQNLNLLFGGQIPGDLVSNFHVWVKEIPHIVAMTMINEKGVIELSVYDGKYKDWMDYEQNYAQLDAFKSLHDNLDQQLFIGPYVSKAPNAPKDIILAARRINKLDGSFGGIVMAAVKSEYFLDFFASIDLGTRRGMSILRNDGVNLLGDMRHERYSKELVEALKSDIMSAKDDESGKVSVHTVDKRIEVLASQKLKKLPLIISVAIDEADFLKPFWRDRFKDLSFLAIFTVFGSILSFFALTMARQIMRVEESEAAAILASQAKSEFLANMSHELRTPLNAIIGFSEMMSSGYFGPLNAKQKERMQDINLCGNHLLHLINDILEFSKGEAGKLEIIEERVNLPQIIDESMRMMNDKIKTKGIRMVVDAPSTLPRLFADKRKVKQVLINLISNAVKFTPQDGEIRISAFLDPNGAMNMIVADNGIGIAEEDIPTALSVFGQVHRSHSHEGTGLGLPLCRMFAELHGGKLALTSVVGEGTTVRIIFPAARVIKDE